MRARHFAIGIGLLIMGIGAAAQTAPDPELDPFLSPETMGVEAWEKNSADYAQHTLTLASEGVSIAAADVATQPCAGFATVAPTYRIDWVRDQIDDAEPLRLFFMGNNNVDTTLLIHEPDGDWLCSEDWDTTLHPLIDIAQMRTGQYAVWVANTNDADFAGQLVVTIGDYTPLNPPPQSLGFEAIFNGSGSAEARVTYVELDENTDEDSLELSVDLVLTGKRGDQFQIRTFLYDAATGKPMQALTVDAPQDDSGALAVTNEIQIRSAKERHDYGLNSKGALAFSFALDDLSPSVTVYPVIRVESLVDEEWKEILLYEAKDIVYKN